MTDFFDTVKDLGYKVALSQEKTDRIRCIIAHEQLSAAAMVLKRTKNKAKRLQCWTEIVSEVGWPDAH
jgi:phenylpropionate dioxygenase-like ring-hydroxylating dioxygenase large terminal subunit